MKFEIRNSKLEVFGAHGAHLSWILDSPLPLMLLSNFEFFA